MDENPENTRAPPPLGALERPNLPDPLRPRPIEPVPFRPGQHYGPPEDLGRILKEILDKLNAIENRLKTIEEQLKTKH